MRTTVRELIEMLERFNGDCEVYVYDGGMPDDPLHVTSAEPYAPELVCITQCPDEEEE